MSNTNVNNNGKQKTNWKELEIGSLWKKESKTNGSKYFTGNLSFKKDIKAGEKINIILFSNREKLSENQPDVKLYISEQSVPQNNNITQTSNNKITNDKPKNVIPEKKTQPQQEPQNLDEELL